MLDFEFGRKRSGPIKKAARYSSAEWVRQGPMNAPDRIVFRELSIIQKIIADETWLEGERRGCAVSPRDPIVRENVCRVILRIGQEMRDRLIAEDSTLPAHDSAPQPSIRHHEAA